MQTNITESRATITRWLTWKTRGAAPTEEVLEAINVLMAATEQPTDEAIADAYAHEAYQSDGDVAGMAIKAMRTVPESSAAICMRIVRRLVGASGG